VIQNVIPKLGKNKDHIYETRDALSAAVRNFLMTYENENPCICYDYMGDWSHLYFLLDKDIPKWIRSWNIWHQIDQDLFKHNMELLFNDEDHHALHDAICNMLSYREDNERLP
jgi:hypothetical protein